MENLSSIQSNGSGRVQTSHPPISDSNDFVPLHSSPGESHPSIPNTDDQMRANDLEAIYQKYKDKIIAPHINAMIDEKLYQSETTFIEQLFAKPNDFYGGVSVTNKIKNSAAPLASLTNVSIVVDTVTITIVVFFMFGGYFSGILGGAVAFFGFQIASTACAKGFVKGGRWNE